MTRTWSITVVAVATVAACSPPGMAQVADQPLVERFLVEGRLAAGEETLSSHVRNQPDDAQAVFGWGVLRLLRAVEDLAQNMHRHGLRSTSPRLPFVRLPVPDNPAPEPLTYAKFRDILQQFSDDLDRAAKTLAKVEDPDVKLRLPVGLIRLDLNGDGKAEEDETFWKVFTAVAWRAAKLTDKEKAFPIGFDKADVHWMIGYTHLLRAMIESWLAYDTRVFCGQAGHVFFSSVKSPYAGLRSGNGQGFDMDGIADLVAAIHLMHFEPVEPERLSRAREHLLAMIGQSRKCWEAAIAETDDDREWIVPRMENN